MHRRMMVLAGVLCCALGAVALGQDAPPVAAVVSAYAGPPRFVHVGNLVVNVNEVAAVNYEAAHPQRSAYIEVVLVGGARHTFLTTLSESEWSAKAEEMVGMNPKP